MVVQVRAFALQANIFFGEGGRGVGFLASIALAFPLEGGTGMPIIGAGIGTGEGEGELGLYGGEPILRVCK